MYLGESDHTLDSKGRLIIPSRFREALGEKVYITRSLDHCLCIYDTAAWEDFSSRLSALPVNDPEERRLVRYLMGGAFELEVDKQGRILIPAKLRESFGIQKEVVLAGVGSRIELWSSEEYYSSTITGEELNAIAIRMQKEGLVF